MKTLWIKIRSVVGLLVLVFILAIGWNMVREEVLTTEVERLTEGQWVEFRSPEGAFSVLLPGTPGEREAAAEGADGNLHSYDLMQRIGENKLQYSVLYGDFDVAVGEEEQAAFFEDMSDVLVKQKEGVTVVHEIPISLGEFSGTEVKATTEHLGDSWTLINRIYLVENRLYLLQIQTNNESIYASSIQKFLDSFSQWHDQE